MSKVRQKKVRQVPAVVFHVKTNFNNTIITVTDSCGNTLYQESSGSNKFSSGKKASSHAGSKVTEKALSRLEGYQAKTIEVVFKGPGAQREAICRKILSSEYTVLKLIDKTPIPHNGTRPPKRRRI